MFNFFLELGNKVLLVFSFHFLQVDVALKLLVVKLALLYSGTLLFDFEGKLVGFYLILGLQIVQSAALLYYTLVSLSLLLINVLNPSLTRIYAHFSFVKGAQEVTSDSVDMEFCLTDKASSAEILALILLIHLGKGKSLVDALYATELCTELTLGRLLFRPISLRFATHVAVFSCYKRLLNLLTLGLQACYIDIAHSEEWILRIKRES